MAGSPSSGSGQVASINVTPLVDVMLVLLVIFIVTTEMISEDDRAIAIDLPQAASSDAITKSPFTVVVTKEGSYIKNV